MHDPAFPVFCASGIFLCLLPLPWHWKARNTGTLLYAGWIILGCTNFLINSLIWDGHTNDIAPVWCDISSKLVIGLSVGVTASSLCINRRLYNIATTKHVTYTQATKRHDAMIDLLLGLALPIVVMVLHYVVQPNRYDILEDYGCWPATYFTLLVLPTVLIWPILISIASIIYATGSIRAFLKTRRQFSRVLSDSASGLNLSRYFRLMALASTEIFFSLPLAIVFTVHDMTHFHAAPWVSWQDMHHDFNRVYTLTRAEMEADSQIRIHIELNRWMVPGGAFLFFMYFGMSAEATEEYKRIFWRAVGSLGIRPSPLESQQVQQPERPVTALVAIPIIASLRSANDMNPSSSEQSEHQEKVQDISEGKLHDYESQSSPR